MAITFLFHRVRNGLNPGARKMTDGNFERGEEEKGGGGERERERRRGSEGTNATHGVYKLIGESRNVGIAPGLGLINGGTSQDQASDVRSIEILRLKRPGRATSGRRRRGELIEAVTSFEFGFRCETEAVRRGIR
ncbi:hypothetical protein BHM03_00050867 [Ensete ventricosum]|nr:hypothetical protein BHM03_00050867 [Ensete ventricosum]